MLNSVIARRPDTADAYISLSHAYWEGGQPQLAIASLEHALASGAPERDVQIRLGIYLAESHADSRRAIKLLEGHVGRGRRSAERARRGLRRRRPQRGCAGDLPEGPDARRDQRPGLSESRVDRPDRGAGGARPSPSAAPSCRRRKAFARKAIDVDPALPDAFTTLGVILSTSGRKADAIDSWKRVRGARPRAVQRALQPLVRARRRRPPRRSVGLRPPVRRHRPARLLPTRHRPHQALPRRGLTPDTGEGADSERFRLVRPETAETSIRRVRRRTFAHL